jgi:hypothetical protein
LINAYVYFITRIRIFSFDKLLFDVVLEAARKARADRARGYRDLLRTLLRRVIANLNRQSAN